MIVCGVDSPETVRPIVYVPKVLEPLYACGGKLTVTGFHAGVLVRVYQNEFSIFNFKIHILFYKINTTKSEHFII